MSEKTARARPRRAKGAMPARSVRVADETWDPARNRAAYEGTTISHVINTFLEGYSKGLLNLPKVQIKYDQPKSGE